MTGFFNTIEHEYKEINTIHIRLSFAIGKDSMITPDKIKKLAQKIAEEFDPDRIILFGSYAKGTPHQDSDVDLLVILPFEGKNFHKSIEIINRILPPFPADILARKPEDTLKRYDLGDPLIREAIDEGKVLYERSRTRMGAKG